MAGRKSDFTLPTLDELFTTQELRDDAKLSKIRDIPLELIDDFPGHPFKVRDDEDMIHLWRVSRNEELSPRLPSGQRRMSDTSWFRVTDENGPVSLPVLIRFVARS